MMLRNYWCTLIVKRSNKTSEGQTVLTLSGQPFGLTLHPWRIFQGWFQNLLPRKLGNLSERY